MSNELTVAGNNNVSIQGTPINKTMTASIEDMYAKAQYLIDKKLVPAAFTKVEVLLQVINMGAALGMDPIQSTQSIDLISGVMAIKAKMIPGLLAKKGISIEVLKDFEPICKENPVYMKDGDTFVKDADGQFKYHRDPRTNEVIYKKDEPHDWLTVVRFKRYFPNIGVVTNDVEFRWSMAVDAEWHLKSNWKKMPRYMMMARCITRGARIAAADVMGGLYDEYEVSEFTNTPIDINED